jgi:hypothetical protein
VVLISATISIPFLMKKFYITLLLLAATLVANAQQPEEVALPVAEDCVEGELSANDARNERGFFSDDCFVPKGQWIFGGTASYSAHRNNNYTFTLINGIDSEGYSVSVSPMIGYAPWKNMAVGIRFGYSRSLLALDNATLSVSGADLSVDMFHQLRHTYVGTLFWRPYIPLGHSNRFAFFAEVQLNLSGGQSKAVAATNVVDGMQNYRGTYAEQFGAQLALQPGIVAFITNNAAVELSIGVLGVGFDRTKQIKNQIFEANVKAIDTNFKLNLLSVGFGMSFYL